jgi:hypothetical protein
MEEQPSRYDQACAILHNTNDGDDLTGTELWLVQERVNNHLNEKGIEEFEKLYEKYGKKEE